MSKTGTAIIGAGMAGLTLARRLAAAGESAVVLESAGEPGGRIASLESEGVCFDHGAQYFTARDPKFQAEVADWRERGLVAPWDGRLGRFQDNQWQLLDEQPIRYVGTPSMAALPRFLADGLDLRVNQRVSRVRREGPYWHVFGDDPDPMLVAHRLVLAVPPSAARTLLADYPTMLAHLASVAMQPCWSLMVVLDKPLAIEVDGLFVDDRPLRWLARNSSKPGRGDSETWVCHAAPAWSRANLEREPDAVIPELGAAFAAIVRAALHPIHVEARLWRDAQADPFLPDPYLYDPEQQLALIGDWCGGSRIEDAYTSASALARQLVR